MTAQWTVLVYLAGDNNLETAGEQDLAEIKSVGSTDAVTVLAQFDRMGDGGTRRYRLTRGAVDTLDADAMMTLPETNTGDPAVLVEFVRWGLSVAPAERLALVLWNHGAGWKDDDIYAQARQVGLTPADLPPAPVRSAGRTMTQPALFARSAARLTAFPANVRGILFDDTSRDFLDNLELQSALATIQAERGGRPLDLLGFDACLMSMVEVAHEVQPHCQVLVGSQEIEPAAGWPYSAVLAALTGAPAAPPERLGEAIVAAYGDYYAAGADDDGATKTLSALRLAATPTLVMKLDDLAAALLDAIAAPDFYSRVLMPAARQVRRFRDASYVDLGDLAERLSQLAGAGPVADAAASVHAALQPGQPDALVLATRTVAASGGAAAFGRPERAVGAAASRDLVAQVATEDGGAAEPSGVSVYWPVLPPVSPAYDALAFSHACRWGRFVTTFLAT